ncbi:hypothetical protein M9Y10_037967 [Tritrichomonas musculus]|uniref:Target of rapamycin complex subunit LST8 n=1 Tax=Tritrichomonas musculus TaxID=1915356 RepID=A0ABR2K7V9_9EUKA
MSQSQPVVLTAGYDAVVVASPIFSNQNSPNIKNISTSVSQVNRIVVAPDNRVALATNPYVLIYDIFKQTRFQYNGHSTNVTDIIFAKDYIYTCSEDRTWRIWGGQQQCLKKVQTGSALNAIALTQDSRYIFTANEKGQVEMYDTKSTMNKAIATIKLAQPPIRSIALSQDNKRLIAACHDGTLFVLGINLSASSGSTSSNSSPSPASPALSTTNISSSSSSSLSNSIFTEICRFEAHNDVILRCAISPDQKTFITTSADSTAKIWDFENYQLKFTLTDPTQEKWIWDAAYTRDSQYVVTAGTDKTCRTWSLKDGTKVASSNSHSKGITALALFYS